MNCVVTTFLWHCHNVIHSYICCFIIVHLHYITLLLDVFARASFRLVNAQWYNCHNLDDEAVKWISPEWRTVDIRCKMLTVYNIFAFIGRKLRSDLSVTVPQCFLRMCVSLACSVKTLSVSLLSWFVSLHFPCCL